MEDWIVKLLYGVFFLAFYFLIRYFFNRWRNFVIEEQRNLYNQQLDTLTQTVSRMDRNRSSGRENPGFVHDENPPPAFDIAVKQPQPVSHIDLDDSPPPPYADICRETQSTSREIQTLGPIPTILKEDLENHM